MLNSHKYDFVAYGSWIAELTIMIFFFFHGSRNSDLRALMICTLLHNILGSILFVVCAYLGLPLVMKCLYGIEILSMWIWLLIPHWLVDS